MNKNSKTVQVSFLHLIAIFLAGIIATLLFQELNQLLIRKSRPQATNYEECLTQPGSKILELHPPRCMTAKGMFFTQQVNVVTPPSVGVPSPVELPNNVDPTTTGYTCPKSEWVDCMPGPGSELKFECTQEFLEWATAHCPKFKGAAL